jgi:hypothetical protein
MKNLLALKGENMRSLAIVLKLVAPIFFIVGALHLVLGYGTDALLGARISAGCQDHSTRYSDCFRDNCLSRDPTIDYSRKLYGMIAKGCPPLIFGKDKIA